MAFSLKEIEVVVKKQFREFELSVKNRLDNLERTTRKNSVVCSRLSEEVTVLKNVVERKNKSRRSVFAQNNPLKKSYITELFDISLPQMRFVTGGREAKLHKLFWVFIHIVAFFISATFIQDAYYNWQNSLIVLSQTLTKVKEIPFPAITICEPVLLNEEYNQFEILKRCTSPVNKNKRWLCSEEELNMFMISTDILRIKSDFIMKSRLERSSHKKGHNRPTSYTPTSDYSSNFLSLDLNRSYSGMEYLKFIDKLGNECSSRLKIYISDSSDIHYRSLCNDSVNPTILMAPLPGSPLHKSGLQSGVWKCHTFNGVGRGPQDIKSKNGSKIVPTYGVKKNSIFDPESRLDNVFMTDLLHTENYVDIEIEDGNGHLNDSGREFPKEYTVFFHNPLDYPSRANLIYYVLPNHTFTLITLFPKLISARRDLAFVGIPKRNCIFSFERKLSLFEFYTAKNCILECQINCSLAICGCVPHTSVIFINSSIEICSNHKSEVCKTNSDFFMWTGYKEDRCSCDCLPDCVSLSYGVETREKDNNSSNTWFRVRYKEPDFLSTYRHSLTSPSEFVAYSLGILGVFNGFCVMLVWEILYWLTLRLWSAVNNNHF